MLIGFGLCLLGLGFASLFVDRRAAHFFYDHIREPLFVFMDRTTHWAKGGYWLAAAVVGYVGSQVAMHFMGSRAWLHSVAKDSLSFLACLAAASLVLHIVKRVFARRRPRDEMEMGLYEFRVFDFDAIFSLDQPLNSFPSGHAMTIMCAAIVASCLWPALSAVWFVIALWLGLTRALLTAHFLSDVFIGAGIAMLSSREVILGFFPGFAPAWF